MYNRYIPQNDGTYRRSRMSEQPAPPPPKSAPPGEDPKSSESRSCSPEPLPACPGSACPYSRPMPPRPKSPPVSIGSFLKQLIPGGFDTEDLIIVLLLLLMAGDCQEDQNTALLTLVLYLFL